jgi:hypothetical protein
MRPQQRKTSARCGRRALHIGASCSSVLPLVCAQAQVTAASSTCSDGPARIAVSHLTGMPMPPVDPIQAPACTAYACCPPSVTLTVQEADESEEPQQWALAGVPDDAQHVRPARAGTCCCCLLRGGKHLQHTVTTSLSYSITQSFTHSMMLHAHTSDPSPACHASLCLVLCMSFLCSCCISSLCTLMQSLFVGRLQKHTQSTNPRTYPAVHQLPLCRRQHPCSEGV